LTGRIQYRRLLAVLLQRVRNRLAPPRDVADAAQQAVSDIQKLIGRGVRLLWLQSQGDFSQGYFETMFGKDIQALLTAGAVRIETIEFTDHTLTDHYSQARVLELVRDWLPQIHEPVPQQSKQEMQY
jgi:hypothetical protein